MIDVSQGKMKMSTVDKHLDLTQSDENIVKLHLKFHWKHTQLCWSPNFLHRFHFFRGTKKRQTTQKIVDVPRMNFCHFPFYFTLIFLVQASLNSGKLQQDILQLVKQADNSTNSLPNGERERQILETYMESIIENGLEEPVTSILLLNSALK